MAFKYFQFSVWLALSSLFIVNGAPTNATESYWLGSIKHQGIAAFNPNSSTYQVFRNVKDFGATGDGVTDDTVAINNAISSGNRCGEACGEGPGSSTITPAVVYFPAGTYAISAPIISYYYTQLIGNPNSLPVIKALPSFAGLALIDGDPYGGPAKQWYWSTNIFWRQVRNFVLDMTELPLSFANFGLHWRTAQATSIQNVAINMPTESGVQHTGILVEDGSGGFMSDMIVTGGLQGVQFGNQQFTMRNLTIQNSVTGLAQNFDWGWTYHSLTIRNCSVAFNMAQTATGSVTIIDSEFVDNPIAIKTLYQVGNNTPISLNSLVLENVIQKNNGIMVQAPDGSASLPGTKGTTRIPGWAQGRGYVSDIIGTSHQGDYSPERPESLVSPNTGKFYSQSKPQYESSPVSSFLSARDAGAKGDGVTDDTNALQRLINTAASSHKIVFIDHGDYVITSTLNIPPGSRIVGESYSVFLGSGAYFADIKNPKVLIQVGHPGEVGHVEWSDMIVSTKAGSAGAILIEWNLFSPAGKPSGMWDVHARVGGFSGSDLQISQCPTVMNTTAPILSQCFGAYMLMHVTKSASGLNMENVWLWVADHDVENGGQITVFSGRGLLIESGAGLLWLYGTAVEHNTLYQYQIVDTQNIYMGQIQTETAYYQPNPPANLPFPVNPSLFDPDFKKICGGFNATSNSTVANCASGWGLRVLRSHDISIYGAGLYSFFSDYSIACEANHTCQKSILSLEHTGDNIRLFNLNTVGTRDMVTLNGKTAAAAVDNANGFIETIALYFA